MGTKHICAELVEYRLSALDGRRKKRRVKAGRQKALLRLDKEKDHWWRKKGDTAYVPLETPYQRGWVRKFELSDETAKGKNAVFFAGILAVINTTKYSHDKAFTKKARKRGKKIRVARGQELLHLHPMDKRWEKLDEAQRQLFYRMDHLNWRGDLSYRYVFNEPWRFVLRTRPNMVTHTKLLDPFAESRYAELDQMVERHGLQPTIDRAKSRSHQYRWKDADVYRALPGKKTVPAYLTELRQENRNTQCPAGHCCILRGAIIHAVGKERGMNNFYVQSLYPFRPL